MALIPLALVVLFGFGTASAPTRAASGTASSLPAFSSIDAGYWHTCGLTTAGAAKCWGSNWHGELGDAGYDTSRVVPVDVAGLSSDVVQISAGALFTCALTSAGAVKCWGWNWAGQLGNGGYNDSSTPVDVVGLGSGVVAISAGWWHACALTDAGAVKCWGWNPTGELGNGTTVGSAVPVPVSGLSSGVVAISAGWEHTCALTSAGGVKCWGYNGGGRLGDGTVDERHRPVDVVGLDSGVAAISAGSDHTCAVTDAGGAKCWGLNDFGQIGDGTTVEKHVPTDVDGLGSGVAGISAGGMYTCAVMVSGGAKCWGSNATGQLGDGSTNDRHVPVGVSGLGSGSGVAVLAGGIGGHTCAVTAAGVAKCWGYNGRGQLSDGTTTTRLRPVDVTDRAELVGVSVQVAGPVTAGTPFTVTARAIDAFGHLITTYDAPATWSSLSGNLSPAAPTDFVNGVSTTTNAKVAVPVHGDRITVTSGDRSGQSDAFDVLGPLAAIAVTVTEPVYAAVPFTVSAKAFDTLGSLLTTYSESATWESLGGGLSPSMPVSFVNGVSLTTTARIATPFQGDRITVTSGGLSGQSGLFDVRAPAAIVVNITTPVAVGAPFTVKAYARDASGHTLTGYDASATWSDRSGQLSPAAPANFIGGVSLTTATIPIPFHDDKVTVASFGTSGTSGPFGVIGPFAGMTINVARPVTAGSPFAVTAQARDAVGNIVKNYNAPAAWSDLSGQLSPATPASFANGVSRTSATVSGPFHADKITISSGGKSKQSGAFDVLGPLSAISVSVPSPVTNGVPFTVKAVARDSAGNWLRTYNSTATWSSLGGGLSPATPSAFVNGISTTATTFSSAFAGNQITVTSGGISGQSNLFNVL